MDTRARLVERTIETGVTLRNAIAEFYRDETGPLTTAWCESIDALRARDAAAKPLPFGCVVREKQNDLWQVENADGTRWWSSVTRRWSDILVCHGFATTEAHAISDFHATNKGVAPPGWVEPKVETVAANANYSLAVPSPEYRTVTDPETIRAVLDRLPVGAKFDVKTDTFGIQPCEMRMVVGTRHVQTTDPCGIPCWFADDTGTFKSLRYRLSDDPQTPAAETVVDLEPADRSPNTQEQLDTLASRVAEVERRVDLEGRHTAANAIDIGTMLESIAALRRDVDAMKANGLPITPVVEEPPFRILDESPTPAPPATARYEVVPVKDGYAIRFGDSFYDFHEGNTYRSVSTTSVFADHPIAAAVARALESQP